MDPWARIRHSHALRLTTEGRYLAKLGGSAMTKRRLGSLVFGLAVAAVSFFISMNLVSGQDPHAVRAFAEPIYYVDGARPPANKPSGPVPESEIDKYCVPYSAQRPDVRVCEELPLGWQPTPKPYFDKEICDTAFAWMTANPDASFKARVEPASCLVVETSTTWHVVFARSDGKGNVHVPYDPTGRNSYVATLGIASPST